MIQFHTRETAAKLLDKPLNTFAAERQRGEMPAVCWTDEAGPGVPNGIEGEARRGYTGLQIFLALIRDEFARQYKMDRKLAARIASHGFGLFTPAIWDRVSEGSAALVSGRDPKSDPIMFCEFNLGDEQRRAFGLLAEVAAVLPADIGCAVMINVTQAAATFRRRAEQHDIDLGSFFTDSAADDARTVGKRGARRRA